MWLQSSDLPLLDNDGPRSDVSENCCNNRLGTEWLFQNISKDTRAFVPICLTSAYHHSYYQPASILPVVQYSIQCPPEIQQYRVGQRLVHFKVFWIEAIKMSTSPIDRTLMLYARDEQHRSLYRQTPWGRPSFKTPGEDFQSLAATDCERSVRYDANYLSAASRTPRIHETSRH